MAKTKTTRIVKDNDHIFQIAQSNGIEDWQAIWNDAENSGIKGQRKNPHILFKSDQIIIPPPKKPTPLPKTPPPPKPPTPTTPGTTPPPIPPPTVPPPPAIPEITTVTPDKVIIVKEEKVVNKKTETVNKFVINKPPLILRLRLLDQDLKPIADTPYTLSIDNTALTPDQTLPDGTIVRKVPNTAQIGKLTIEITEKETDFLGVTKDVKVQKTLELRIGKLNPILEKAPDDNCVSGVQARLINLGFNTGGVDGQWRPGSMTESAIKSFQKRFAITPEDGLPSVTVQNKLKAIHDTNGPIPASPTPPVVTPPPTPPPTPSPTPSPGATDAPINTTEKQVPGVTSPPPNKPPPPPPRRPGVTTPPLPSSPPPNKPPPPPPPRPTDSGTPPSSPPPNRPPPPPPRKK